MRLLTITPFHAVDCFLIAGIELNGQGQDIIQLFAADSAAGIDGRVEADADGTCIGASVPVPAQIVEIAVLVGNKI